MRESEDTITFRMRYNKLDEIQNKKAPQFSLKGLLYSGIDILSRVVPSTICAGGLNYSVRNGKR